MEIAWKAAGGLALFLLAMQMMTEGLKVFAGSGLRRLLGRWTSTPWRGVLAGILVTGVVQSSSAVTVATIGFVNAGLLTLQQALGVIFGTNVGTTMTGWLVSLVGFGVKIEAFALPILTAGVAFRLVAPARRGQGLGEALAGFGLFFLGLAILKDAFSGLAELYGAAIARGEGGLGVPAFLAVGLVATLLTQSSSAAIALILTAASGGVIGLDGGAAAVIGANLGTTSTAAIAALRATPAAKRLALGHIAFNLGTAVVALALLPLLLWLTDRLADGLDVEGSPAALLALFHTVFNSLGVVLMLPLAARLANWLERLFRSAEEDLARPQHIDPTLASTPDLAVAALREELLRLRSIATSVVRSAVTGTALPPLLIERQSGAVRTLVEAIEAFAAEAHGATLPESVAEELARALRIARYLGEAARLAPRADTLRRAAAELHDDDARRAVGDLLAKVTACLGLAEHPQADPSNDTERAAAFERFLRTYEDTKSSLLRATVAQRVPVDEAGALLDSLSATRRLSQQLVKADRLLRSPQHARAIDADTDAEGEDPAPAPGPAAHPEREA